MDGNTFTIGDAISYGNTLLDYHAYPDADATRDGHWHAHGDIHGHSGGWHFHPAPNADAAPGDVLRSPGYRDSGAPVIDEIASWVLYIALTGALFFGALACAVWAWRMWNER